MRSEWGNCPCIVSESRLNDQCVVVGCKLANSLTLSAWTRPFCGGRRLDTTIFHNFSLEVFRQVVLTSYISRISYCVLAIVYVRHNQARKESSRTRDRMKGSKSTSRSLHDFSQCIFSVCARSDVTFCRIYCFVGVCRMIFQQGPAGLELAERPGARLRSLLTCMNTPPSYVELSAYTINSFVLHREVDDMYEHVEFAV
jgi:hypothetical protein